MFTALYFIDNEKLQRKLNSSGSGTVVKRSAAERQARWSWLLYSTQSSKKIRYWETIKAKSALLRGVPGLLSTDRVKRNAPRLLLRFCLLPLLRFIADRATPSCGGSSGFRGPREPRGLCLPGPVKISHKKDGHQRRLQRFHEWLSYISSF